MLNNQKKLVLGVFAVVVIVILAFLLFSDTNQSKNCPEGYHLEGDSCILNKVTPDLPQITGSFEEQYEQLSEIWQENGVKSRLLHEDFDDLTNLTEGELQEISGDIANFKERTDNESLKELSNVYMQVISVAASQKKLLSINNDLKTVSGSYCDKLELQEDFSNKYSEFTDEKITLFKSITNAVELYGDGYKEINLYKPLVDYDSLKLEALMVLDNAASLSERCEQ